MNKEIKKICLKNDRANDIPMFANYTHFKFSKNGLILSSNKGIGLPKVFINIVDVAFITYK